MTKANKSLPVGFSKLMATAATNFPQACKALSSLMGRQGLEWADWNEWGTKWAKDGIKQDGYYRQNTHGGLVGIMHKLPEEDGYLVLALKSSGERDPRLGGGVRIPEFDHEALIAMYADVASSQKGTVIGRETTSSKLTESTV